MIFGGKTPYKCSSTVEVMNTITLSLSNGILCSPTALRIKWETQISSSFPEALKSLGCG